jgi:hypothetical protein
MPFLVAFVCLLVMAAVLASCIGLRGPATVSNGIRVGFLAWLGFVVTSMTVNHRFTSQRLSPPPSTAATGSSCFSSRER